VKSVESSAAMPSTGLPVARSSRPVSSAAVKAYETSANQNSVKVPIEPRTAAARLRVCAQPMSPSAEYRNRNSLSVPQVTAAPTATRAPRTAFSTVSEAAP